MVSLGKWCGLYVYRPHSTHISGLAWKVLGATSLTNFVVGLDRIRITSLIYSPDFYWLVPASKQDHPFSLAQVFPRFTLRISVSQAQSPKLPDNFLAPSVLQSSLRLSLATIRQRSSSHRSSGHFCTSPALRLWRAYWKAGCPPGLAPSAPHNEDPRDLIAKVSCSHCLVFVPADGLGVVLSHLWSK